MERYGWPVVLKPLDGEGGRGVITSISSYPQLHRAMEDTKVPLGYLIEKQMPGSDYRFLVAGDQLIGAWRRDAANVVGEGSSTIEELIDVNDMFRARNPHLASRPIGKGAPVVAHLAATGRGLATVPPTGEEVYLRGAANLSSGGDNFEVLPEVHPSLAALAVAARRAMPAMELAGVDLLAEDHRKAASDQQVSILEVNSLPGISAHEFPAFGAPSCAAKRYLEIVSAKGGLQLLDWAQGGAFRLVPAGRIGKTHREHVDMAAAKTGMVVDYSSYPGRAVAVVRGTCAGAAAMHALLFSARGSSGGIYWAVASRIELARA